MKLNNSHYKIIGILILLLLVSTLSYSQGFEPFNDAGFEDDDVDDIGAPINGLIALGLAIGGYLGIRKIKK